LINSIKEKIKSFLNFFPKFRKQQFLILERLTGYRVEKKRFKQMQGYELNLKNPKTFNEKIVWKKIYDRNPLLPVIADKYKVRKYVIETLGKKEAENILIPLLYVTDKPETIPFENFPDEYVIKPNHSSGKIILKERYNELNPKEVIETCEKWLVQDQKFFWHEWAYQNIDRKIVIEKLIRDKNKELPYDFKFHMSFSKCLFIQVDVDRFTDMKRILYDEEWKPLPISYGFKPADLIPKPDNFSKMLSIARNLSENLDYIRVDLYSVDERVYFGELTNYPQSGYRRFKTYEDDLKIGMQWPLRPGYWK
jgi:hypothetical protein